MMQLIPEKIPLALYIAPPALQVIQTLQDAGFEAYAVGGCIRDQLLGLQPKDFDVVTNANPEVVKTLFKRCLLIGKRFRLAHVYVGRHIIEVSTFRRSATVEQEPDQALHARHQDTGIILRDNIYGTIEEDALRRDFTINALYYEPTTQTLLDFAQGMADIDRGLLKTIGDPNLRFQEDPVRMLRAIRFCSKLNISFDASTQSAIAAQAPLLTHIPAARRYDEYTKLFMHGYSLPTFKLLQEYGLLPYLLPSIQVDLAPKYRQFFEQGLRNSDSRVALDKKLNPAFLLAVLLWPTFQNQQTQLIGEGVPAYYAMQVAANITCDQQALNTAFPRRTSAVIKQIWLLQNVLEKRKPKHTLKLLANPRFRAAYDFLLLREFIGEVSAEIADWWTKIQQLPEQQALGMIHNLSKHNNRRRPPRRRYPQGK